MIERFPLRRPPFWTRGIFLAIIGMAVLVGLVSGGVAAETLFEGLAIALVSLGAFLTLAGLVLALRLLRLPKTPPELKISAEGLELPIRADSRKSLKVSFRELKTVELRFAPPEGFLIIESLHRTFLFRVRDFATPTDLPRFGELLKERLANHPEGETILAGLAIESQRMRAAITRPTRATHIIIGTLTAVFALQLMLDATFDHVVLLLRMGAGQGLLMRHGEAFRVVTATYLHANFLHFGVNLFGLFLLGGLVERVIGPWRFLFIYLVGGIVGAAASGWFFPDRFSVGASGAIFGVLGGYAIVSLRHHRELPGGFRVSMKSWLLVLMVNGALPLLVPIIDWMAHLGGLLGGALAALPIVWSHSSVEPLARIPGWQRALALFTAALWLAATAAGVTAGIGGDLSVLVRAAKDPSVTEQATNAISWGICIDTGAERDQLRHARDAARVAVERSGNELHVRDTLAQCEHRMREAKTAVDLEISVVEESLGDPMAQIYATQLGRFARTLEAPEPALLEGIVLASRKDGVELQASAAAQAQEAADPPADGEGPRVEEAPPPLEGMTRLVWYEVFEDSRAVGMLRLCLGPKERPAETRMPIGAPEQLGQKAPGWPQEAEFRPRVVRVGGCEPPASGWSVHYWAPDPFTAKYP